MVKYLGIRVAGAILLVIYTATDITLNILQLTGLGPKWLPIITLVVFMLVMVWIIYDLKKANENLLDNRPTIDVEAIKEGDAFYLKVHNKGAEGLFKAQIQLSSPDDPSVWCLPHYNGCWKYENKSETTILKGHDDFLKVAELCSSHPSSFMLEHLKIWFFDQSANYVNYISTSTHWIGATITSPDGSTRPITKHEYELQVTISSSPNLRDGVFRGSYILDVDGLRPGSHFQSAPDKKGSPN